MADKIMLELDRAATVTLIIHNSRLPKLRAKNEKTRHENALDMATSINLGVRAFPPYRFPSVC